jgi:proteasome assembly chaperone (PAC2) family protein
MIKTPCVFQYETKDEDGNTILMEGMTQDYHKLSTEELEEAAIDIAQQMGVTQISIKQLRVLEIN